MSPVNPSASQLEQMMNATDDGPFVMVNLLKFKEAVNSGAESGAASYMRYAENVQPLLEKVGARATWMGLVDQVFIGETGDDWDAVLLVEYPSKSAFLEMVSSSEYGIAQKDRETGLEKTVLLACKSKYIGK